MINNMISISLDGKPCVSEAYYVLFIYNSINLILVRVERKSLIRKTLILIRVPFVAVTFQIDWWFRPPWNKDKDRPSVLDPERLMRRHREKIQRLLSKWAGDEGKSEEAAA